VEGDKFKVQKELGFGCLKSDFEHFLGYSLVSVAFRSDSWLFMTLSEVICQFNILCSYDPALDFNDFLKFKFRQFAEFAFVC
jgi:hypothetical protein